MRRQTVVVVLCLLGMLSGSAVADQVAVPTTCERAEELCGTSGRTLCSAFESLAPQAPIARGLATQCVIEARSCEAAVACLAERPLRWLDDEKIELPVPVRALRLFGKAREQQLGGDASATGTTLAELLALEPGFALAHFEAGLLLRKPSPSYFDPPTTGAEAKAAEALFLAYAAVYPDDATGAWQLTRLYRDTRQYPAAIAHWQQREALSVRAGKNPFLLLLRISAEAKSIDDVLGYAAKAEKLAQDPDAKIEILARALGSISMACHTAARATQRERARELAALAAARLAAANLAETSLQSRMTVEVHHALVANCLRYVLEDEAEIDRQREVLLESYERYRALRAQAQREREEGQR